MNFSHLQGPFYLGIKLAIQAMDMMEPPILWTWEQGIAGSILSSANILSGDWW